MLDQKVKEHATILGIGLVWWFLGVFAVLGAGAIFVYFQPWFMRKETENTRQSDQYITTKQAALRELKSNHDSLEVKLAEFRKDPQGNAEIIKGIMTQQRGIVRQMREQADLIPNHVPDDIKKFLDKS